LNHIRYGILRETRYLHAGRRAITLLVAGILLSCGESVPEEAGNGPCWNPGLYEGLVTASGVIDISTSLVLREDGTGLILIDAFQGFFNGPADIVSFTDSTLTISFRDGDGQEVLAELERSTDSLTGFWYYQAEEHDLTGEMSLMFASADIPTDADFFATSLFVPADFEVPEGLETEWCRLRMLSVDDVELDYEAVMSSGEQLRELSGGMWPEQDMTIEEDLSDLEMHQSEHESREAFTYTIISLDEDSILGCIYIMPPRPGEDIDAAVRFWLRQNLDEKGMGPVFYDIIRKWIAEEWPFENVLYTGRDQQP
jgi:hypothetical protein